MKSLVLGSVLFSVAVLIIGFVFHLSPAAWGSDPDGKSSQGQSGWSTNQKKRSIDLSEIMSGGVGKDGIPAIYEPRFESPGEAARWLKEAVHNVSQPIPELAVVRKKIGGPRLIWFSSPAGASAEKTSP
jgi:hypothetical protein